MTAKMSSAYRRVFRVKDELPDYAVIFHLGIFAFLFLLTGFLCVVLLGMLRYGWFSTAASMKAGGAMFDPTDGSTKAGGALFAQTDGSTKVWDALFDPTDGSTKVWDALFDPTDGSTKVWDALFAHANASKKSEYAVI